MAASTPAAGPSALPWVLAEGICLVLVLVVPSFFNLTVSRAFEEEKALLLRSAALLLGGLVLAGARWPEWLWRRPVVIALAVFTAILLVAALAGLAPSDSLWGTYYRRHGLATWLALATAFIAMSSLARASGPRNRLLAATIVGSLFPAAYAICQRFGLDPITWTDSIPNRAGGTAGNALLLSGYLCVVLPATVFAWLGSRRSADAGVRRTRPLLLAALLVQAAGLLATGSRGPTAAVVVGLAVGGLSISGARRARLATVAVVATLLAGGGLLTAASVRPQAFDVGSGRVRALIWQGVIDAIESAPSRRWLGFGPETLRLIAPKHYAQEFAAIEGTDAMPDRAHNETLDTLVSAGAAGVIAQWAFLLAVLTCAAGDADPWRRAALVGAAASHIAELQLGIATTMSRLAFFTYAAVATGSVGLPMESHSEMGRQRPADGMSRSLLAAMLLTAAAAGGMSLAGAGTTVLYATAALAVLALTRSIGTSPVTGRQLAACGVVAAASATLTWTVVLPPSRADRLARIAEALERRQDWPGAVSGYRAALSLRPSEPEYLTGLGRSLLEQAERDESRRDQLFSAADETLRQALARNPYDPHHSRNVANAARRRAAVTTEPAARGSLLAQADQLFERATAAAPGMALLWVDWGNVALVRGALDEASSRLDRAERLDATNVELWVLRALVEVRRRRFDAALAAYDRALVLRSDHAAALRGRAVVLATMGRTADAIGATERLLRFYPSDDLGLRLKASLAAPGAAVAAP